MLEKALADGYHIIGIFSVDKIQQNHEESLKTGFVAGSVDAFIETSNLRIEKNVLLDPKNKGKFIIVLRKEPASCIGFLTSDPQCLNRAKQQLAFQNESIGLHITVRFSVSGGSSEPNQVSYIDKIIDQLNQLLGWDFKKINDTYFEGNKELSSTNEEDAVKELEKLRTLLTYIAICRKIGIRIESYMISKIPRLGPYICYTGPQEFMAPPLTADELKRFETFVSASPEIRKLAEGLNETYLLKSPQNRLIILWAITEAIFNDEPEPLLSKDEVESILDFAAKLPTLRGSKRLEELRRALSDPNRLPSKSRNRRISENMAKELNLDAEGVYRNLQKTSSVVAKYRHRFEAEVEEARSAERFLRPLLERYLEKRLAPSSSKN